MIRAFVGVRIDSLVVQKISEVIEQLKPRLPGIRWVPAENLHFTLKFLGWVEAGRVDPVVQALEQSLSPFPRFIINAKGLGVFPDFRRPRVLWVGLEGDGLAAVASKVEIVLEPLNFARESRAFKPHLTLGRWRQFERSPKGVGDELERRKGFEFGPSTVREVILFQSTLRPEGAVYTPLRNVKLARDEGSAN